MVFILTSWFAWNVFDYNYGKNAEINLAEYCAARDGLNIRTGIFPMEFFQLANCPVREVKKNNERLEKYRTVAELITIGQVSYFLGCQKEGDCSPRVMSEYEDGRVEVDHFRQSEVIHDNNYKISPDKKRIIFLRTVNNINSLYLYNIEMQVGVDIESDINLKSNETVACEIGSYGMDAYSCGEWLNDSEFTYGIYEKSKLTDKKFKLLRKEIYIVK